MIKFFRLLGGRRQLKWPQNVHCIAAVAFGALAVTFPCSAAEQAAANSINLTSAGNGPVSLSISSKIREKGTAEVIVLSDSLLVFDKLDTKTALHQWILTGVNALEKHKVHLELDRRPGVAANVLLLLNYSDKKGGKSSYGWSLNLKNGKATPRNPLSGTAFLMSSNDKGYVFDTITQSVTENGVLRVIVLPVAGPAKTGAAIIRKMTIDKSF
jgi:hypothetical protein